MNRKIYILFIFFSFSHLYIGANSLLQDTKGGLNNFDKDFKERYNNNKYNYEGKGFKTTATNSKNGDAPYSNKTPREVEDNNKRSFTIGGNFLYIAIIIFVLAIAYLAYILLNEGSSGLFSSKRTKKLDSTNEITAETIENTDLDSLIKKAEKAEDYRLAIRYNYLSVLKSLSLKGIIKYEDEKTNGEYQQEIENQNLNSKFSYVSYLYNYIWYGEFYVDQSQYFQAKNNFAQLLQKI